MGNKQDDGEVVFREFQVSDVIIFLWTMVALLAALFLPYEYGKVVREKHITGQGKVSSIGGCQITADSPIMIQAGTVGSLKAAINDQPIAVLRSEMIGELQGYSYTLANQINKGDVLRLRPCRTTITTIDGGIVNVTIKRKWFVVFSERIMTWFVAWFLVTGIICQYFNDRRK